MIKGPRQLLSVWKSSGSTLSYPQSCPSVMIYSGHVDSQSCLLCHATYLMNSEAWIIVLFLITIYWNNLSIVSDKASIHLSISTFIHQLWTNKIEIDLWRIRSPDLMDLQKSEMRVLVSQMWHPVLQNNTLRLFPVAPSTEDKELPLQRSTCIGSKLGFMWRKLTQLLL